MGHYDWHSNCTCEMNAMVVGAQWKEKSFKSVVLITEDQKQPHNIISAHSMSAALCMK